MSLARLPFADFWCLFGACLVLASSATNFARSFWRIAEFPQLIWLHVHTDEGHTGLGETFRNAASVEAYIHEEIAPLLLGRLSAPVAPHSILGHGLERIFIRYLHRPY